MNLTFLDLVIKLPDPIWIELFLKSTLS
jgi:hypothetical protein